MDNYYIVNKTIDGKYVKTNFNNKLKKWKSKMKTSINNNTFMYGGEIVRCSLKTNESKLIPRLSDIVWFNELIVNGGEIDDLSKIEVYIGGSLIWGINIPILEKMGFVKCCDSKIIISMPKKLFFIDQCIVEIQSDDLMGIPIVGLMYHEVRFKIVGTHNGDCELVNHHVYVCKRWKWWMHHGGHNISIVKLCDYFHEFVINKFNNGIPHSFVLDVSSINLFHKLSEGELLVVKDGEKKIVNAVFSCNSNMMDYFIDKDYEEKCHNTKKYYLDNTLLSEVVIGFIVGYGVKKHEEKRQFKIILDGKEYYLYVNELGIMSGMGGLRITT